METIISNPGCHHLAENVFWNLDIDDLKVCAQITVIPVIVTAVTNNLCNKKVQKFGKFRFLFLGGYYF